MVCGLLGWRRKIARRIQEGKLFYRSAASTLKLRGKKKLLEKVTWYRTKRKREDDADVGPRRKKMFSDKNKSEMQNNPAEEKQETVKGVMFVPYTVGSELAKRLKEAEIKLQDMRGYRLQIVERSGLKLEDMLHNYDPWQGQDCGRD